MGQLWSWLGGRGHKTQMEKLQDEHWLNRHHSAVFVLVPTFAWEVFLDTRKTSWRKTGWALSSPHLQSPQGREDPQGRLSDELRTGKPLPGLSAPGSARADGQAGPAWSGMEQELLQQEPAEAAALHPAPSRPQNVQYCFAPSTHSLCGCRFTFR